MITVKKFSNREDAELARHQLEAAGIHGYLGGENGGSLLGSITTGGFNIEVDQADKAKAEEVLAEMGQADDISDAELEALALSEPGTEHEVEPSANEPEAPLDPADGQRTWRGLCWGGAAGVLYAVAHSVYDREHIEQILPTLTWRIPLFALLGAILAQNLGKSRG